MSPWSTHGNLTGTKNKTQKKINEEASLNFEKEMAKHKNYFKQHNIFVRIYTDNDLKNIDDIFDDMKEFLSRKLKEKNFTQFISDVNNEFDTY